MTDFPLIRRWMPRVQTFETKLAGIGPFIHPGTLEAELSHGLSLYCDKEDNGWHCSQITKAGKTHSGLLIGIQPLAKPVRKRELSEEQVREALAFDFGKTEKTEDLISRLFGDEK